MQARMGKYIIYTCPRDDNFGSFQLNSFDVSAWNETLTFFRIAELCLHFTSLIVVHRVSASKFRLTSFPDVGYNERLPLAPCAETNRQPAISWSRYSIRTVCGDARCELRTGSYRSTMADRVGVCRRCFDVASMRDMECARDYVDRSMSQSVIVKVARRFPSVRSECGDAHWELRTGSYRSVTADRAGIRFRCLGLEAMRGVRCAQDFGGCRSMVVPLELRGTSSFFADNRLRWVSRSPVFVIWQYNIEDVKWKWDWLVRRLSPVYILVSVPTSKHND